MNPSIADTPAGTPGPSMPRAILESPFAAPKALREGLAKARQAYDTPGPEFAFASFADGSGGVIDTAKHASERLLKALGAVQAAEAKHRRYLKALALHVFGLGFAPFASHALYTQWLDDNVPDQRTLGIQAGFAWAQGVQDVFVGIDLGVSAGMELGISFHRKAGRTVHEVTLGPDWGRAAPRRRPLPDAPEGGERP